MSFTSDIFRNRSLVIATKHGKEKVIAPLLEARLGVRCIVNETLNTDELGTFTGEIPRTLDPLSAAREKCRLAMELTGCDLAVASEGSFGPHPSAFFIPSDEEYLVFTDRTHNLEIWVKEISTATNFGGQIIQNEEELLSFADKIQFPSHGLILRKERDTPGDIYKGITDKDALLNIYHRLQQQYGSVFVETDMRAMHNPLRMAVIEKTTEQLVEKINALCPECKRPGFGITGGTRGLPCDLCGSPTRSVLAYERVCAGCGYTSEEKYPHGKQTEDPMYCDVCNP